MSTLKLAAAKPLTVRASTSKNWYARLLSKSLNGAAWLAVLSEWIATVKTLFGVVPAPTDKALETVNKSESTPQRGLAVFSSKS